LGKRRRDISQRTGRHQGHGAAGGAAAGLHNEIDRVTFSERLRRFVDRIAVDAGLAVRGLAGNWVAHQWPVAAGVNGNVGSPRQFQDQPRITLGEIEGHVAGHRSHPQDIEFRRRAGEQQHHRVVLPGVAIDDNRPCHGAPSPLQVIIS
jgi:hypothetical protein